VEPTISVKEASDIQINMDAKDLAKLIYNIYQDKKRHIYIDKPNS